jgi:hypothetical protein
LVNGTVRNIVLGLALCASSAAWAADSVSGAVQNGYGRLTFTLSGNTASKVSATSTGGVLAISFSDKTTIDPASVVAAMRAHFAPKMKGTPDANLFAVLSSDIDQHGLAFREAAAKIASIDTLQSFMKDFAKRKSDAKS